MVCFGMMRLFTSADYFHVHPSVRSLAMATETRWFLLIASWRGLLPLRQASSQVMKPSLGACGDPAPKTLRYGTPRREKEHPDTSLAISVFTTHRTAICMQPDRRMPLVL